MISGVEEGLMVEREGRETLLMCIRHRSLFISCQQPPSYAYTTSSTPFLRSLTPAHGGCSRRMHARMETTSSSTPYLSSSKCLITRIHLPFPLITLPLSNPCFQHSIPPSCSPAYTVADPQTMPKAATKEGKTTRTVKPKKDPLKPKR